jgi:hypothetical protein
MENQQHVKTALFEPDKGRQSNEFEVRVFCSIYSDASCASTICVERLKPILAFVEAIFMRLIILFCVKFSGGKRDGSTRFPPENSK